MLDFRALSVTTITSIGWQILSAVVLSVVLTFSITCLAQKKDPYEVLGVARTATGQEIKSAYLKLAKKYHTDRYPPNTKEWEEASEKLKEINNARDELLTVKNELREPGTNRHGHVDTENSDLQFYAEAYSLLSDEIGSYADAYREQLLLFTNEFQVKALEHAIAVRGRSVVYDLVEITKFNSPPLVEALRIAAWARDDSVHYDYSHLLKFDTDFKVEILRTAAIARVDSVHYDYPDLLKFTTPLQAEAFEIAAKAQGENVHYDYSDLLKFNDETQVAALKVAARAMGEDIHYYYANLLKFQNRYQVDALRILANSAGSDVSYYLNAILEFDNADAVKRLRAWAKKKDDIEYYLKNVLDEHIDYLAKKYEHRVSITWTGLEEFVAQYKPADPRDLKAFQRFVTKHLQDFISSDHTFDPSRIARIAEVIDLPAVDLVNPALSARIQKFISEQKGQIKTGMDLLGSPLLQNSFLANPYNREEVFKFFKEEFAWLIKLPMTVDETHRLLESSVFESGSKAKLVAKMKWELIKAKLVEFDTLEKYKLLLKTKNLDYVDIWNNTIQHFLSLTKTLNDVIEFLPLADRVLAPGSHRLIVEKAIILAKNLDELYSIPVIHGKLTSLNLIDLYRSRQKELGASFSERVFQFPNSRKKIPPACAFKVESI